MAGDMAGADAQADPIRTIALNNGRLMPQVGLGTWPLDDSEVEGAIVVAAGLGYRHIDTGEAYGNEVGVGRGIRASGVPRDEFFVSTKLDGKYQGGDRAVQGLEGCLARMRLEYVDLLLIHWPLPLLGEYVSTWRSYERLLADGLTTAIGVSNFSPAHLTNLIAQTEVIPAVNQVQIGPQVSRPDYLAFHEEHGIVTTAWSPLGGNGLLDDPIVARIAAEHDVSAAQVVLRWHTQQGIAVIPKSTRPERLAENRDVFDFDLTPEDFRAMKALEGTVDAVDPDVDGH